MGKIFPHKAHIRGHIMRAQTFLRFLNDNYDHRRAANLATNTNIRGGWEIWLQVEIAYTFVNIGGSRACAREIPYPSGNNNNRYISYDSRRMQNPARLEQNGNSAARCDFYLSRRLQNDRGIADDTYVELKCINPNTNNPLDDAWNRFYSDINKIQAISGVNNQINGVALLATYGTFAILPGDTRNKYVWDPTNNAVTRMTDVNRGNQRRFFIVAAS